MKKTAFYICPTCFRASDEPGKCHEHDMICCDPGNWGDFRRKPVTDTHGMLLSRAPRWFLEATGWIQADGRYTPL